MKCVELAPNIFHLQSGSNMGLLVRDGHALLIDAGLDGDAGRRALRVVEEQNARLEAIIITHAHADHFGGARYLQERLDVPVYAPELEAAMIEHPVIEPFYLFGGASPIAELRTKFTLAEPCHIDQTIARGPLDIGPFHLDVLPLPGHALNQTGVGVEQGGERILFSGDAIFPEATIEKHKVLFCVDLDQTLKTIQKLEELPYDRFAPGHGPAYTRGSAIETICRANRDRLHEVREAVYEALETAKPTSALVQRIAERFELKIDTPTAFFLTRTTILAALSSLQGADKAAPVMRGNRLMWAQR